MSPVDLSNVREMIGNDPDLERALIDEFFRGTDVLVVQLRRMDIPAAHWRAQAHALKGLAYNLGAAPLGDMARKAQESWQEPVGVRRGIAESIVREYETLKHFLQADRTAA